MKTLLRGLLAVMCVGVFIVNVAEAAGTTSLTTYQDYGTVTHKFTLETDSLEALGHHHKSTTALKTDWAVVPYGVPFTVFVECPDYDSTTTWGPDTIGLALETTPFRSVAYDSAGSAYKYSKADIMWDLRSVNWTAFASNQHYFDLAFKDTLNDTIAIGATSLKSGTANKQITPIQNLGYLRFSLCVDAADSVLDGLVRLNCYIVFRAPDATTKFQFGSLPSVGSEYADIPRQSVLRPEHASLPNSEPSIRGK